jgi:hypothetical protein
MAPASGEAGSRPFSMPVNVVEASTAAHPHLLERPGGGEIGVPERAGRSLRRSSQASGPVSQLDLVGLSALMGVTEGRPEVVIGLIDGPVAIDHPELATERISTVQGAANVCVLGQPACAHGTFVAGILAARRGTDVPAICPGCTLLVRPIFGGTPQSQAMPTATSQELAAPSLSAWRTARGW